MFRTIKEQIDTIFREDPAARSVIEIFFCYPGFHAILLHRLAHKLYSMQLAFLARLDLPVQPRSDRASRSIPARRSAAGSSSTTAWAW